MTLPYEVTRYRKRNQIERDASVPGIQYKRPRGGWSPAGLDISSVVSSGSDADELMYHPAPQASPLRGSHYEPYRGMPTVLPTPSTPELPPEPETSMPNPGSPSYAQTVRVGQIVGSLQQRSLDGIGPGDEAAFPFSDPLQGPLAPTGSRRPSASELFDLFDQGPSVLPEDLIAYQMSQQLETMGGVRPDIDEWINQDDRAWELIEDRMTQSLGQVSSAMSGPSMEAINQALSADPMAEAHEKLEQVVDDAFHEMQDGYDQHVQQLMDPYMMPPPAGLTGPPGGMGPGGMPGPG